MPVYSLEIRFSAEDLDEAVSIKNNIANLADPYLVEGPTEVVSIDEVLRIAQEAGIELGHLR